MVCSAAIPSSLAAAPTTRCHRKGSSLSKPAIQETLQYRPSGRSGESVSRLYPGVPVDLSQPPGLGIWIVCQARPDTCVRQDNVV